MGRAGGGGGGRSSGGGHSSSRSGGGHRVGGGSRARGSYSSSRSYSSSHSHHYHHHHGIGGYSRSSGLGEVIAVLAIFIVIVIIALKPAFDAPKSTINREKLTDVKAFDNDCIVDEIGWFDNVSKTGKALKEFWEETGVQPYIVLRAYDPSLTTDAQKEAYCIEYYDNNIKEENVFLYMYFAEADTDNDVGFMAYANGKRTSSVMDSEAIEIFWHNIDRNWYTDMSTDDLFIETFTDTGHTIMRISTTFKDILKYIVIFAGIVGVGIVTIAVIKKKRQAEKEKAAETERILNSSISEIQSSDATDDLAKKYQ